MHEYDVRLTSRTRRRRPSARTSPAAIPDNGGVPRTSRPAALRARLRDLGLRRRAPPPAVSTAALCLMPPVTLIVFVWLGEVPRVIALLGCATTVLGVVLINRRSAAQRDRIGRLQSADEHRRAAAADEAAKASEVFAE